MVTSSKNRRHAFIDESVLKKSGKNIGKRSIWFNGSKTDKITGEKIEYVTLHRIYAAGYTLGRSEVELANPCEAKSASPERCVLSLSDS